MFEFWSVAAAFCVQIVVVGTDFTPPGLSPDLPAAAEEDTNHSNRGYGLPCTRDEDCFVSRGLSCRDFRCNCSALNPVRIKDKETCLPAKAMYEACMYNEECIKGSANLLCLDYLCYCPLPYVLKDNTQCVPSNTPVLRTVMTVVPAALLVFLVCFVLGSYACRKLFERPVANPTTIEEGSQDETRSQWAIRSLGDRSDSAAIKLENTHLSAIHSRFLRPTRSSSYRNRASDEKPWSSKRPPRFIPTSSALENLSAAGAMFPSTFWSSSEDITAVHKMTPSIKAQRVQTPAVTPPEKVMNPSTEAVAVRTEGPNTTNDSQFSRNLAAKVEKPTNENESEELRWQETPSGQSDDAYVAEPTVPVVTDYGLRTEKLRTQRRVQMTLGCRGPSPQTKGYQNAEDMPDLLRTDRPKPLTTLFERSRKNIHGGSTRLLLELPKSLKPANPFAKNYSAAAGVGALDRIDDVEQRSESTGLSASSHELLPKPGTSPLGAGRFTKYDPDAVPRFSAALFLQEDAVSGVDSYPRWRGSEATEFRSDASESVPDLKAMLIGSLCKPLAESLRPTESFDTSQPDSSAFDGPSTSNSKDKAGDLVVQGISICAEDKKETAERNGKGTKNVRPPNIAETFSAAPREGARVSSKTSFQKPGRSSSTRDVYNAVVQPETSVLVKPSGTFSNVAKSESTVKATTKEVSRMHSSPKLVEAMSVSKNHPGKKQRTGELVDRSLRSCEDNYVETATKMMVAMIGNEHYRRERSNLRQSIAAGQDKDKPPVVVGIALDEAQYILQYDVNLRQQEASSQQAMEWKHSPRPGIAESQAFVARKSTAVRPSFQPRMTRANAQGTPLPFKDIRMQRRQAPPMVLVRRDGKITRTNSGLPTVGDSGASDTAPEAVSELVSSDQQRNYKRAEKPRAQGPTPKPRSAPPPTALSTETKTHDSSSVNVSGASKHENSEETPVPLRQKTTQKLPAKQSARVDGDIDSQRDIGTHATSPSKTNMGDSREVSPASAGKANHLNNVFKLEVALVTEFDCVEKLATQDIPLHRRRSTGRLHDEDQQSSGPAYIADSYPKREATHELRGKREATHVPDRRKRLIRYWSEPYRIPRSVFIVRKQFSEPIRTPLENIPEVQNETLMSGTTLCFSQSDYSTSTDTDSCAEVCERNFTTPQLDEPSSRVPVPLPRECGHHSDGKPPSASALREKVRKIGVQVLQHPFSVEPSTCKVKDEPEGCVSGGEMESPTADTQNVRSLRRSFQDTTFQQHVARRSSRAVPRPRKTRPKESSREAVERQLAPDKRPSKSVSSSLGRSKRATAVKTLPAEHTTTGNCDSSSRVDASAVRAPEYVPQPVRRPRKARHKSSTEMTRRRGRSSRKFLTDGRYERARPLPRLLPRGATSREQPESSSSFSVQDTATVDSSFAVTSSGLEHSRLNCFRAPDVAKRLSPKRSRDPSRTNSSEPEWYSCPSADSDTSQTRD